MLNGEEHFYDWLTLKLYVLLAENATNYAHLL